MNNPDIFKGSVYKPLIKLSLPIFAGLTLDILYNIVDTYFLSLIDKSSTNIVSGVGLVFPLYFIIIAIVNGAFMGTTTIVSNAVGKNNEKEIGETATGIVLLSIICSVLIAGGLYIAHSPLIDLLAGEKMSNEAVNNGKEYFVWILPGTLFLFLSHSLLGIFQGEGNAKVVGIGWTLSTVANIILDPIFIFGLNMGVKGAAIATVISFFLSFIYVLYAIIKQERSLSFYFSQSYLSIKPIIEIIRLSLPQSLSMITMALSFIAFNWIVSSAGENEMNAYTLVGRFDNLVIMPIIGFSLGLSTMLGQNFGRENYQRFWEVFTKGVRLILICCGSIALIYMVSSYFIFSQFSTIPSVIEIASQQVIYLSLILALFGTFETASGFAFQSIKRPFIPLFVTLIRFAAISIPLALLLAYNYGFKIEMVWIALGTGNIISGIIAYTWFKTHFKPHLKNIPTKEENLTATEQKLSS